MLILVQQNSYFLTKCFLKDLLQSYNTIKMITIITYCGATLYLLKTLKCIIPF